MPPLRLARLVLRPKEEDHSQPSRRLLATQLLDWEERNP
jgi:hypothetical protein